MLSILKKVFSVALALLIYGYGGIAEYEPSQDKDINVETVTIKSGEREISAYIISLKEQTQNATGVLWLHGGGYLTGMKEMALWQERLT